MMRRILTVLTVALVLAAMMVAPAFAAGPGFGSCPKNYTPVEVEENGTTADEEANKNGNQIVCEKTKKNGTIQYRDDLGTGTT